MTGFYPYHPSNQAFLTFHGDRKDMIGIMFSLNCLIGQVKWFSL